METLIIFSPLILFLIILIVVFSFIGKIPLKQAVMETSYPIAIEKNSLYNTNNIESLMNIKRDNNAIATSISKIYPPTVQKAEEVNKVSISRLMALVTGILTIIFVLLVCCLFIYCFLKGKTMPDLDKLVAIFVSLGIGVVPYSFNKVSTALGNKKSSLNGTNLQ